MEDLGDDGDRLLGFLGTRYYLRLAMLQHRCGWTRRRVAVVDRRDRRPAAIRSETPFQVASK